MKELISGLQKAVTDSPADAKKLENEVLVGGSGKVNVSQLDEVTYKRSGNFAFAEVNISGISKTEFYAHSSIDELSGTLSERVPEISTKPNNPIFKATEAPNKNGEFFLRDSDTEYKILNDIAARLGNNTNASGTVTLFTELHTCASCTRVINEFAEKYKKINVDVIHNNDVRITP